jgi:hypothetical protein
MRTALTGALGIASGVGAGCLGGAELAVASAGLNAAKTGGAIWDSRQLVVATTIPVGTLQSSVRRAFYALGLEMRWERLAKSEWDFAARDDSGRLYHVRLDQLTERMTKVSIEVGTFGDVSISRLVLTQVQREVLAAWDPNLPQAPWAGADIWSDPMMWRSENGSGGPDDSADQ